jgi:hypothetical protein
MSVFEHFMEYYLNIGVHKFLINFNYKIDNDKYEFEKFLKIVINSKYIDKIIYNIGPNTESLEEGQNINMIKELVLNNVNINEDFIIPADADEFQEFPDTLENTVNLMNKEELSYLHGCTKERISETGDIIEIKHNINIFEQFPKYNNKLFVQPKIGIIKAKYFKYVGVGHHQINNNNKNIDDQNNLSKNKRITITNHFRWNLQGKLRLEKWYKLMSDENYKGWKDLSKYEKMLDIFNKNLLEI